MKLQYLGDSRDSFKWDLLHFLAAKGGFDRLCLIPYLTPDDPIPTDGRTAAHRFPCRPEVLALNEELRGFGDLSLIHRLGKLDAERSFEVHLYEPGRFVGRGTIRAEYFAKLHCGELANSLLFIDPDNGFETKTQRGEKWVRHDEVRLLLNRIPQDSAIAVYQHRARRRWLSILPELRQKCFYSPFFLTVYESNLAFVILSKDEQTVQLLATIAREYVVARSNHPLRIYAA